MSHVPHELREEFPEFADTIHKLKEENAHFRRVSEEYHEVNRSIHRLENGDEHASQFDEDNLRKERIRLKDEIYSLLKTA
ncbi:YdcH family protein [Kordiimonas sp.]|uniref:YdcH family protein n=1 Tax=Kordiimonas sp. TaxID=1970157 RepID=UPI003A95504C